jgi:HEAT repeat protein
MKKLWIAVGAALLAGCATPPTQQGDGDSQKRARWISETNKEEAALPKPPPLNAVEVNPSLRQAAQQELDRALAAGDPMIRMHAMEAAQNAMGSGARDAILKGLADDAPGVRFAAAVAAGELRIEAARSRLLELLKDKEQQIHLAAIFALHRLGDTRYSVGLEAALENTDPEMRGNAVFLLGRLGEKSAVKILRPMLQDPSTAVRVQAAEALWRLGNEAGLEPLVADSLSRNPDIRMVGLMGLAGPRDARVIGHVRDALFSPYDEVKLVGARAMGMLGSDAGFAVAVNLTKSTEARQRNLAALALGAIARPDAQEALSPLLKDTDPDVRLAAAAAILELK